MLRSVYNNLSKDPNSLANLDQDLPNFTQSNVCVLFFNFLFSFLLIVFFFRFLFSLLINLGCGVKLGVVMRLNPMLKLLIYVIIL